DLGVGERRRRQRGRRGGRDGRGDVLLRGRLVCGERLLELLLQLLLIRGGLASLRQHHPGQGQGRKHDSSFLERTRREVLRGRSGGRRGLGGEAVDGRARRRGGDGGRRGDGGGGRGGGRGGARLAGRRLMEDGVERAVLVAAGGRGLRDAGG